MAPEIERLTNTFLSDLRSKIEVRPRRPRRARTSAQGVVMFRASRQGPGEGQREAAAAARVDRGVKGAGCKNAIIFLQTALRPSQTPVAKSMKSQRATPGADPRRPRASPNP